MSLTERPYLSIGEVLGLLLEEFPDVTISKIRFLESQGLIDPERTPSGYRKFYDADVERLRVILREQRENFLPLRIIRDRLERGEIDDTGGTTPPRGIRNVGIADDTGDIVVPVGTHVPTAHHPAAQLRAVPSTAPVPSPASEPTAPPVHAAAERPLVPSSPPSTTTANVAAFFAAGGDVAPTVPAAERNDWTAADVCAVARLTSRQLADLEAFGILAPRAGGGGVYSAAELDIARVAARFLEQGVEARHLRAWRQAVDREAALFEQLVAPLVRQRNPQSRQQAAERLVHLSALGGELRAALLRAVLEPHLDR